MKYVGPTTNPSSPVIQSQLTGYVPGSLALGVNFATTNVDTSTALYAPVQNVLVVAPAASSEAISFSAMWQTVYSGAGSIINGGHIVGAMGWCYNIANGTTLAMGIGLEGRFDHSGSGTPTTTRAHGLLGLVSNAKGTMTNAYGARTEFQVQAGCTIGTAYGYQTNVAVNAGTISKFVAFGMPLITGVVAAPTSMLFIENLETAAPIFSMSPVISAAYILNNGTATGFTITIPANISHLQLNPSATLASGTVNLPLAATTPDGFEMTIATTQTVTSFTLGGNGGTVLSPPTTLVAGACLKYKFFARGVNAWGRMQ